MTRVQNVGTSHGADDGSPLWRCTLERTLHVLGGGGASAHCRPFIVLTSALPTAQPLKLAKDSRPQATASCPNPSSESFGNTNGMMLRFLLLVLLPAYVSAGGSVSVNIKDLGAIEGIQSLDIRGAKWFVCTRASNMYTPPQQNTHSGSSHRSLELPAPHSCSVPTRTARTMPYHLRSVLSLLLSLLLRL